MEVLHDEWEAPLAEVAFARLTDGASWRVGPKGFVVRAAIVVTGEAEEAGDPEDEKCRGVRQEAWEPLRLRAEKR